MTEVNVKNVDVSDAQRAAVERVARFVVRFGLAVPAILALESVRPLSFVGSQFMYLLSPADALLSEVTASTPPPAKA